MLKYLITFTLFLTQLSAEEVELSKRFVIVKGLEKTRMYDKPMPANKVIFKRLGRKDMEYISAEYNQLYYSRINPFLKAAHYSFAYHYELKLSPDIVWLVISQGVGQHIQQSPETYREKFVNFDGQMPLHFRNDGFVKGSANNNWAEAFSSFSKQIRAHIGKEWHDILVADFTTTQPIHRTASEIALMHAMGKYFVYNLGTDCGIPAIILTGTVEDWEKLYEKASRLESLDLNWWLDELLPVLEQFIAARKGEVDVQFWKDFYHLNMMSGGPDAINGHILAFFPYVMDRKNKLIRNPYFTETWQNKLKALSTELRLKREEKRVRLTADGKSNEQIEAAVAMVRISMYDYPTIELPLFPAGISYTPFVWKFSSQAIQYDMLIASGFVGVYQDPETEAFSPAIGWAIKQNGPSRTMTKEEVAEVRSYIDRVK